MITRLVNGNISKRRRRFALLLSFIIHGIAVIILGVWLIKPMVQETDDTLYVDVIANDIRRQIFKQNIPKPIPRKVLKVEATGFSGVPSAERIPVPVNPLVPVEPLNAPTLLENVTRLAPSPESVLNRSEFDGPALSDAEVSTDDASALGGKSGSGTVGSANRDKGSIGLGNFTKDTRAGQGFADLAEGFGKLPTLRDEIGDKLGGILKGSGNALEGHIRIIRLKHSLSDWWQDPTAVPSLIDWLKEWTPIRADMSFAGGALPLTDPKIMNAPLIIMTGHDRSMATGRKLMKGTPMKAEFTQAERIALRKYVLERGGTLFFDDCGLKATFSNTVEHELRMIFPEFALEKLPHEHELYKIFFNLKKPPEGGEVFWGSENKAKPTRYKFHRGIYVPRTPGDKKKPNLTFKDSQGTLRTTNRLGVIFNRKDYLCAMETAEINSRTALRLRRSTDVYRFMTNLMIYTLKYGGNTNRSEYKE